MTDSTSLTHKKCKPCEGGQAPLIPDQYNAFLEQLKDWRVEENKRLIKEFTFKNFMEVISFVNKIAAIAESEGHHPDLNLHNWNKLTITLTTFAIGGLSENDFILAAKIDEITQTA
jgi:4a-hydroxytetrahydrobiopterin dehydratase